MNYAVVCPFVCRLFVTLVCMRPTQPVEIFGNVSTPFGTMVITEFGTFRAQCVKVLEDVVVKKFTFAISSPDVRMSFLFPGLYYSKDAF